jgi:hypothetical protein
LEIGVPIANPAKKKWRRIYNLPILVIKEEKSLKILI